MNNNRLNFILDLIGDGVGVADIGTDHGYIPCKLAERGYSGLLFASDINSAPLDSARSNALSGNVEDKIRFILCNGISNEMLHQVDTIVIAGMGGETICNILDHAESFYDAKYRFIFQPMTKAEILRYWLIYNGFSIEEEYIVNDGKNYQIFCARFGGLLKLSDAELYTGSYQQIQSDPLFPALLTDIIIKLKKSLHGEESKGCTNGYRYRFTADIVKQLTEWEETSHDNK